MLTTNLASRDVLLKQACGELQEHQLLVAQLGVWGAPPGHSLLLGSGHM
jgi:hypothetical protein